MDWMMFLSNQVIPVLILVSVGGLASFPSLVTGIALVKTATNQSSLIRSRCGKMWKVIGNSVLRLKFTGKRCSRTSSVQRISRHLIISSVLLKTTDHIIHSNCFSTYHLICSLFIFPPSKNPTCAWQWSTLEYLTPGGSKALWLCYMVAGGALSPL